MTEEAKKKRDELAETKRIEMELELGGSFAKWCDIIFKNGFDTGYQMAMDEANERIKKLREALENFTGNKFSDAGKYETARAALKADEGVQNGN